MGIELGGKFEAVYARVVHAGENDSLLRGFEIRGYRMVCFYQSEHDVAFRSVWIS